MILDRLKRWIKTWKYDCSHPEWLVAKTALFCMAASLVFLFGGWWNVGYVFLGTGCGVLLIPLMILFPLVLLEDARRKTPISNMLKVEDALNDKLTHIVQSNANPVDRLSTRFGTKLAEFSLSMNIGWFVPMLQKIETAGVPGPWDIAGDYLVDEFEKLRIGTCKTWILQAGTTAFYLILKREEYDTLSVWICSEDKDAMQKLNAAAIAQIEICETESIEGNE